MSFIIDHVKYSEEMLHEDILSKYERDYGIQFLFGGAYGTKVYGTGNALSDVDYKFVHKKCSEDAPDQKHLFGEDGLNDIFTVDIDYIKKEKNSFLLLNKRFPSVIYRNNNNSDSFDLNRTDYYLSYLFEIMSSNYIYDKGYLVGHYEDVLENISIISVCDYYFTRAYMHYNKTLRVAYLEKTQVQVKAILACFVNICMVGFLLKYGNIPYPSIDRYLDNINNIELKKYINGCLQEHQKVKVDEDNIKDYHLFTTKTQDFFSMTDEDLAKASRTKKKPVAKVFVSDVFYMWAEKELNEKCEIMKSFSTTKTLNLGDNSLFAMYIRGKL